MKKFDCRTAKENISIADFLSKMGFEPKRTSGKETAFISPIREQENTPSFFVNTMTNKFFDHGAGVGGDLIKLAQLLFNETDIAEILEKLTMLFQMDSLSFSQQKDIYTNPKSNEPVQELRKISIYKTKELGSNQAITDYLLSRGISINTAEKYCKEVYFFIEDKCHFGLGNQNENGWALRNKYWKGCSAQGITNFKNGHKSIVVFEEIFDLLSYREIHKADNINEDFLVLNSLSKLNKAIPIIGQYDKIDLMLDNDRRGVEGTNLLLNSLSNCTDLSSYYGGYKDLDEYLMTTPLEAPG